MIIKSQGLSVAKNYMILNLFDVIQLLKKKKANQNASCSHYTGAPVNLPVAVSAEHSAQNRIKSIK